MKINKIRILNVINMISPLLLISGIGLVIFSSAKKEMKGVRFLMLFGVILISLAVVLRIIWGIGIKQYRKK